MRLAQLVPGFIRRNVEIFIGRRLCLTAELIENPDYQRPWRLHLHLTPVEAFIRLPFPGGGEIGSYFDRRSWGVSFHFEPDMKNVFFRWGDKCRIWDLPFVNHVFRANDVQLPDGSWTPFVGSWEEKQPGNEAMSAWNGKPLKDPDGRYVETHPYRYELRGGAVQNVTATCHVERMTWRRKWLTWTRWSEWSRKSLEISFSDEVGERAGSYKGGCIGCSWAMLPDETIEQALRRMEAERKFG